MSEQQADTTELKALADMLGELVTYCSALKQGASGFAYMLPAEWQGPAMANFIGMFEKWQLGAEAMTQAAEGLQDQVSGAHQAYTETIDTLDGAWSNLANGLSG
ncbi:WXG100 family type VII secretion target [Agromyces mediolanus]|uniref:WXG100 family type VII secretion target n=1 Tax=Agromyces mediolanus TaxID=41986 RepID=UPI00203D040A|nr:WXG100 family type VII secretion target [Agromyces mediolanus]MCM3655664.1 WXG100 family type VII secretion target [Agromyces mediolanus]